MRPLISTNVRFKPAILRWLGGWSPGLAAAYAEKLFVTPIAHRAPEDEAAFLAEGQRFDVRLPDGVGRLRRVTTWTFGGTREKTALLVHGWSGRGGQMQAIARQLLARGYKVIVFDHFGHGASESGPSSLADFVAAIKGIDRHLGPFDALVGHSLGGSASALAAAEGVNAAVVVTIGAPSAPAPALERFGKLLALPADIIAKVGSRLERRFGRSLGDMNPKPAERAELLIIHDRLDREVPIAEAARLAAAWPNASMLQTEGLGHRRIVRDAMIAHEVGTFVSDRVAVDLVRRTNEPFPRYDLLAVADIGA